MLLTTSRPRCGHPQRLGMPLFICRPPSPRTSCSRGHRSRSSRGAPVAVRPPPVSRRPPAHPRSASRKSQPGQPVLHVPDGRPCDRKRSLSYLLHVLDSTHTRDLGFWLRIPRRRCLVGVGRRHPHGLPRRRRAVPRPRRGAVRLRAPRRHFEPPSVISCEPRPADGVVGKYYSHGSTRSVVVPPLG